MFGEACLSINSRCYELRRLFRELAYRLHADLISNLTTIGDSLTRVLDAHIENGQLDDTAQLRLCVRLVLRHSASLGLLVLGLPVVLWVHVLADKISRRHERQHGSQDLCLPWSRLEPNWFAQRRGFWAPGSN